MRVALIWRYLHHYKIPFYRRLSQVPEIDLTVLHGGNTWSPKETINKIYSEKTFKSIKINTIEKEIFGAVCVIQTGILKHILKNKYDVIVCEGNFGIFSNFTIALVARVLHAKFILYCSGWDRGKIKGFPAFFKGYYGRLLVRLTHGFICYGSNAKKQLEKFGANPSRCFVVQNTIDTEEISSKYSECLDKAQRKRETLKLAKKKVILSVGRLIYRKRSDLLIEAFQIIRSKRNDICLFLIGDGPERHRLEGIIKNKGIPDVNLLGAIIDDVWVYFAMADMFVLPGTGGLAINEAMAFGLPVICSEADGTEKDLIIDGKTGLFFKKGDANSLADKMILLLAFEEDIKSMGQAAHDHIYANASMSLMINNFVGAIRNIDKTN
jgi:glycosyltransferase involved in cell wall biosynthesis